MALPNLPARGQKPWYDQRTAWDNAVSVQLDTFGQRLSNVVVDLSTYSTVQAGIDVAPAGSTLYFPSSMGQIAVPPGGFQLKKNNHIIEAMGVEFQVSTWGTPAFLALRANGGADGHTFRIGMVRYVGVRGNHTGTAIRGSSPYCSGCGVWSNGDRNFIEYLRTDGMPTPIFFSSWDGTSTNDRMGTGNRIGYLEAARYNFALLFVAQDAYDWGDAYCHDDLDDSGGANPTHAIYGSATATFRCRGGVIGKWKVENNMGGAPFQIKFTDGFVADTLTGNGSAGIISVQNSHDFSASAILGTNVKTAVTGSRMVEFVGTEFCKRPTVGRISVDKATGVDTESILLICDENGYFGAISITSRNATNAGAELAMRGVGNFSIPTVVINARGVASRPVRFGNGVESGKAVGWYLPNIRSTGGGVTFDPIPVEEFAQCHSNAWGIGAGYLIGSVPNKGIFRRNMSWRNSAPAVGTPRGWTQIANGGLSSATWAANTSVAAGVWGRLADGRVIRYSVAGTTGSTEPNPTTLGETGTDGTASWEYMATTSGAVTSDGNL